MLKSKFCITVVIISFLQIAVFDLLFAQKKPSIHFRYLGTEDGLHHADVVDVVQDSIGFIWMGTLSGLHRYDGQVMVHYANPWKYSASSERITKIVAQGKYIWVGTQDGLFCFDTSKEKYLGNSNAKLNFGNIADIGMDSFNRLWVLHENGVKVVSLFGDQGVINVQNIEDLLEFEMPNANWKNNTKIELDGMGNIILMHFNFLKRVYLNKTGNIHKVLNFEHQVIPNQHNEFYMIKQHQGVLLAVVYNTLTMLEITPINDSVPFRQYKAFDLRDKFGTPNATIRNFFAVSDLLMDSESNLWIAGGNGLAKIESPFGIHPKFFLYQSEDGLSSSMSYSVFEDNTHCIWLGMYGSGVCNFDLKQIPFEVLRIKQDNTNISFGIKSICEDEFQNIWIGTSGGGIRVFNKAKEAIRKFTVGTDDQSISSNEILSLYCNGHGKVFAATQLGLDVIVVTSGRVQTIKAGKSQSRIIEGYLVTLVEDNFGTIWAGAYKNGLFRVKFDENGDLKTTDRLADSIKLSSNSMRYLYFDKESNELLVCTSGGLNRLILNSVGEISQNITYRFDKNRKNGLSSEYIMYAVKESDGVYWLATIGGGLNKISFGKSLNNEDFTVEVFDKIFQLPTKDVESVLKDSQGNIWVAGMGLSRFNRVSNTLDVFNSKDGLQGNRFLNRSACKASDGTLYFGGMDGVSYFDPTLIYMNEQKAKPIITSIKIRNQALVPGDTLFGRRIIDKAIPYLHNLVLKHNENDLTIYFASLHFANSTKNKFKYRLLPHNTEWRTSTFDPPFCNYSNLKPDEYTLQVMASNNNGKWSDDIAEINIKILYPWWNTLLARVSYVILFILIVSGVYYYQIKFLKVSHALQIKELNENQIKALQKTRIQFFTNISHEFRTPLTLLNAMVKNLYKDDLSGESKGYALEIMQKNINLLLTLVNEIMDFRKLEAGKMKVLNENVDVKALVEELTDSFKPLAEKNNIQFYVEFSIQDAHALLDRTKLTKILNNLLSNSFSYNKNGGNVFFRVADVVPSVPSKYINSFFLRGSKNSTLKSIYISVEDSGVGMSQDELSHIFEAYYQAQSSGSGTGIGLALTKKMVTLCGFNLYVHSTKNEGSFFVLEIPLLPKEINHMRTETDANNEAVEEIVTLHNVKAVRDVDAEENNDGALTILVVEDNEDLLHYLKTELSTKYNVLVAPDGSQGLEIALAEYPDMIISDVMMPGIDGNELCRRVKSDFATSHIPVLLLTAQSSVDNTIKGLQMGADLFVSKPFNIEVLMAQIEGLFENRKRVFNKDNNDPAAEVKNLSLNKMDEEFLQNSIRLVELHLSDTDFNVEALSYELHMNRKQLYVKLKALTNQNPVDFIKNIRLSKAVKMIKEENLSLSEIAYVTGFSSPSYFNRAFRKKFDMAPGDFKRKFKK